MDFFQVAGTNAKGSTATYLAHILMYEKSTGLFTSPHLNSACERFWMDGLHMTQAEYAFYAHRFSEEKRSFARWTKMALAWFEDCQAKAAVMETGLGGRLDPTNVVPSRWQIITPIGMDHTQLLGDSIGQIAAEKAGIIKLGSTVVSHPQHPEALEVIQRASLQKNAKLCVLDPAQISLDFADEEGQTFDLDYAGRVYKNLKIRSNAPVQVQNACVAAITAIEYGARAESIRFGLAAARFPARFQKIGNVIIDGAHNTAAIQTLKNSLEAVYPNKKIVCLTAMMSDKDCLGMAQIIQSFAQHVVCTCVDQNRGLDAEKLAGLFHNAVCVEDPVAAIRLASQNTPPDCLLVVCGSFYLAAEALSVLGESFV